MSGCSPCSPDIAHRWLKYNFRLAMASVRRHLASLGLAVVLCHLVMQILVPAALCCQKPLTAGKSVDAHECCAAGAHPGQTCPMRGKRAASQSATDSNCAARPMVDLHDILITLSSGGVIPALVSPRRPRRLRNRPRHSPSPSRSPVARVPLGPPPRA